MKQISCGLSNTTNTLILSCQRALIIVLFFSAFIPQAIVVRSVGTSTQVSQKGLGLNSRRRSSSLGGLNRTSLVSHWSRITTFDRAMLSTTFNMLLSLQINSQPEAEHARKPKRSEMTQLAVPVRPLEIECSASRSAGPSLVRAERGTSSFFLTDSGTKKAA